MGYSRVVGMTTIVNTYIDTYCSLVCCTEVLNAVVESHGLICACCWSLTSSVDQSTECWSEMHDGKLHSAAVAENDWSSCG